MDLQQLIDVGVAGFVLLGTLTVTFVRTGRSSSMETVRHLARLTRRPFNLARQRAELASRVEQMRQNGVFRGSVGAVSDPEFADATAALIHHRSTDAMVAEHQRHRALRHASLETAVQALERAGELSPVLGLAGTLLALSQLPGTDLAGEGAVMASVSSAVVSTLYGLLLAHLVWHPLASAIERRAKSEEKQREELTMWLVNQLKPACPTKNAVQRDAA
ncbi:MotA/TolQ/ExbB proton channel family protein [Erythrobacter sp. MTPC3]|uniref:MotA/TolQ/ExbB proton channel family protein n=1 Tax=Erythrobacter sp. MTPC3 TaxID=3056564 RepID=UPI0036F4211F